MGRPRKPTHLKLVTGTAKTGRENRREPKVVSVLPDAPKHLSRRAKAIWPRFAGSLHSMGVLGDVDREALEELCECWGGIQQARANMAKELTVTRINKETGVTHEEVVAKGGDLTYVSYGKDGYMVRVRPELALIADGNRRLMALLTQFGLTPASRSKVNVIPQQDADPAAEFFA